MGHLACQTSWAVNLACIPHIPQLASLLLTQLRQLTKHHSTARL